MLGHFISTSGHFLLLHLSQNLDAYNYFEGLNVSKSKLDQKLKHKTQIFLFSFFSIFEEKILKIYDKYMAIFSQI